MLEIGPMVIEGKHLVEIALNSELYNPHSGRTEFGPKGFAPRGEEKWGMWVELDSGKRTLNPDAKIYKLLIPWSAVLVIAYRENDDGGDRCLNRGSTPR